MGLVGIVMATSVFYGVTTYVKHDNEIQVSAPVVTEAATITESLAEGTTTPATATSSVMSATTSPVALGKKKPFTDIMNQGGSFKCNVMQTVANMTSNGTVYIHDALVRAEFSMSIAGQSIDTTMIARDGYIYSWTSGTPTKGYKAKINGGEGDGRAGTSGTYTWNGSQIGDYTCEAWVADDKKFDLPKGTTFTAQ